MSVEFVSYSGEYPSLCHGVLTFLHNGEKKSVDYALASGGRCYFTDNYANEHVEDGEWEWESDIDLGLTKEEADDLLEQVNCKVRHGCCGGCL